MKLNWRMWRSLAKDDGAKRLAATPKKIKPTKLKGGKAKRGKASDN